MLEETMRIYRQHKYERETIKWALMGKCRLKRIKRKSKNCTGYPIWYTEFSLLQLKELKELKETMFKDNEEQTTFRTLKALLNIGMITDVEKIESKIIKKLVNEFNKEPIKFLCEVYKAITGNYFENDKFKDYSCTERIILSGIAFLELPKIILELHKRLPPIFEVKLPPKPKSPKIILSKKGDSPYLEKFSLPPNWRAYYKAFQKWHKKVSSLIRPVVILPKIEEDGDPVIKKSEKQESFNNLISTEKQNILQKKILEPIEKDIVLQEIIENEMIKSNNQEILENNKTSMHERSPVNKDKQDQHSFSLKNWTNLLSQCPYKYRKLMEKVGPLNTDEEFFSELGYEPEKKHYPAGRENLSVNMQSYLLGLETNLFKVTDDVDKLSCEVKKIAKEILDSDPQCDPCCVCRQTQKSYLKSLVTKAPHMLIDSVVTTTDNKTQVIGATAMHSPAPSITSYGEPPYIPSTEQLVKNIIITGTLTTIDGEPVNQVEGFTKAVEHIPHKILLPDPKVDAVKNVPPCKCSEDCKNKEEDLQTMAEEKNLDLCYGGKFRADEGPTYTCGEFKKKSITENDYEIDNFVEKFIIDDECGCGIDFQKCTMDGENDYENSVKSSTRFEHILEETAEIKKSCNICKRCGRKTEAKCKDAFTTSQNKKKRKILNNKCSCNSLSEFLQFDLTKIQCNKLKQKTNFKEIIHKKGRSLKRESEKNEQARLFDPLKNPHKCSYNKMNENTETKISMSLFSMEEEEKVYKDLKNINHIKRNNNHIETETINKSKTLSIQDQCNKCNYNSEQVGPFGLKTVSEDELPVERTIAYLTPQHPPDHPAGQIPFGKGKRPCRCRENRNNRKTLKYNIGGLTHGHTEENQDALPPVIEGVTWLTPEPSIRRSDEYIPEYVLYDSPYQNQCGTNKVINKYENCKMKKDCKKKNKFNENKEGEKNIINKSRSQDWQNSFNDPYLTDMFINKPGNFSNQPKCSKFSNIHEKSRKLKVMNAACECKYERKIVKRKEDKKKWFERQTRLKSFKKEPVMHISEICRSVENKKSIASELPDYHCKANMSTNCSDNENEIPGIKDLGPAQIVISAVTMHTPVCTPVQSKINSKISVKLTHNDMNNQVIAPGKNQLSTEIDSVQVKITNKTELIDDDTNKYIDNTNPLLDTQNIQSNDHELNQIKKNDCKNIHKTKFSSKKLKKFDGKVVEKYKKRESYFDGLEENLKYQMHEELKKMANENYISLKLPKFYRMPQLLYWISYRIRGMHYSNNIKKELLKLSEKKWIEMKSKIKRKIGVQCLGIKKKNIKKLNFDSAIYWKTRIAQKKLQYYTQLRHEVLNLGRDVWPSMQFGKFPDIIFKQAFFTYLPSREKDAHVVCLWL